MFNDSNARPKDPGSLGSLDTCKGSFLHWAFCAAGPSQPLHWWRSWLLPFLLLITIFSVIPVTTALLQQRSVRITGSSDYGQRPRVFHDYNMICMGILTLPLITLLLLTERSLIPSRIERVRMRGIIKNGDGEGLRKKWENLFYRVNIAAQVIGLGVGAAVASINLYFWKIGVLTTEWMVLDHGAITITGWVVLGWLLLPFYFVSTIYVIRAIATALMLQGIVAESHVEPQPFHGDNAGGLSPIASIGLRNQYVLAAAGVNIVCLRVVMRHLMYTETHHTNYLEGLVIAAGVFYLLAAPTVFVCPLLPFRKSMRKEKARLLEQIGDGVEYRVDQIISQIKKEPPTKDDEEALERLAKLRDLVIHSPVWPFDTQTLKQFLTAYLLPLATAVAALPPVAGQISSLLTGLLQIKH